MSSISFGQLTLVVHAIRLHEALDMAPRLEELVLYLVNEREIASLLDFQVGHLLSSGSCLAERQSATARQVLEEHHIRFLQYLTKY